MELLSLCAAWRRALRNHEPAICHHLNSNQHNTDMGIRDSVSKPFKKLKHRLAEGIHKPEEGSRSDSHLERRKTDAEESEAGQSSHLYPKSEDVTKSGPSREDNDSEGEQPIQVNPPTSARPISHGDSSKPDGM
jgi:hypothetical protein